MGFRTPNLDFAQSTFDNLFTVMQSGDYGPIQWDSSISEDNTNKYVPGDSGFGTSYIFPYTMNDGIKQSCENGGGTCDQDKKLPGLWEFPMTVLFDKDDKQVGDGMDPAPQDGQTVEQILKDNFLRHYNGNRAPLGIFLHGGQWLPQYGTDLVGFANDVLANYDDVYFVTVPQFLAWMLNPVTASDFTLECFTGNSCLPPNSPGAGALAGTCGYGKMNLTSCECHCDTGASPDAYGMCVLDK